MLYFLYIILQGTVTLYICQSRLLHLSFPGTWVLFFKKLSLIMGGGLQNRFAMYSDEQYMLLRQEQNLEAAWFLQIVDILILFYIILAAVILRFTSSARNKDEENLFSFLLLFLSFVNFGKEIPSFGGRFQMIFYLFGTLYIFLQCVKMSGNKVSLLTLVGIFPMLLYTAITFRQGSDSINAWLLTPGLGLPFLVPGISISELLF